MPLIISGSGGTTILSGSSMTGSLTITGSLTVSGSNTITNYGSFVSNEAGGDFDFRVESTGSANMLFVDGGQNRIGIGTPTPLNTLSVTGSLGVSGATTFTPSATATLGDNGTIPVTSTVAIVDAGGGNRTGIRFNAAGSAGQILIVKNTGDEDLTFDSTEGTCLVRGISADADTIESEGVYVFISDGEFWNFIGGGADSAGDGLGEG